MSFGSRWDTTRRRISVGMASNDIIDQIFLGSRKRIDNAMSQRVDSWKSGELLVR